MTSFESWNSLLASSKNMPWTRKTNLCFSQDWRNNTVERPRCVRLIRRSVMFIHTFSTKQIASNQKECYKSFLLSNMTMVVVYNFSVRQCKIRQSFLKRRGVDMTKMAKFWFWMVIFYSKIDSSCPDCLNILKRILAKIYKII